ncbi:MAG: hypothetical protein P0Y58_19760 [Candidatus Pseudomonas phytovorans]|uniref:Transmembrane protein n=1 Tax=Candidatus Pseudomonas phytovorans TaxID=3121377 RepID=A0AAJ5WI48_9PSED|nr:hypothetical protein [Pseudomonas sp.]WEK29130.1 MAG: hypothetical protein P0Y58_19760 [Pseudomonas sp.]
MELKEELKLEKYRYVLAQKQALNEATFKIVAVYQALVLALAAGQYTVVTAYAKAQLKPSWALPSSYMLLGLFIMVSALILALLVGGVLSWKGYRDDESKIEHEVLGVPKAAIKWRSLLCWYETYLVLFVLIFGGLGIWVHVKYIFLILTP